MHKLLSIQGLSKSFNNGKVKALQNVSFSLEKGKIISIVGESGCGKTTLIRLISGLETPDAGEILMEDTVMSSETKFLPPENRDIGMVFQDCALFPHLTVYQNVTYGVRKNYRKERATQVLDLVGLSGYGKRYPHELSGGQQQRVALARALAPNPKLLILDEPFSNLDVILRKQLRQDIANILRNTAMTAIFITHDIKDALAVSDEILVLQNGLKIQIGNTQEVYNNPADEYVKLLFED